MDVKNFCKAIIIALIISSFTSLSPFKIIKRLFSSSLQKHISIFYFVIFIVWNLLLVSFLLIPLTIVLFIIFKELDKKMLKGLYKKIIKASLISSYIIGSLLLLTLFLQASAKEIYGESEAFGFMGILIGPLFLLAFHLILYSIILAYYKFINKI